MISFAQGYLLNSLWQVPLLFLWGWLAARLLRPLGALAEHRVWAITLLLQALLPACTLSPTVALTNLGRWLHSTGTPRNASVTTILGPGIALTALHLPATLLSLLTVAYATFLACLLLRFAWRALALSALSRSAAALSLNTESTRFFERCTTRFAVPDATVATSSRISGPITFGLRRKLILLPASMLAAMSERDLHAVLAHEFAHLHRHDFLKNLLYQLVAVPVSYHPVLWLTRTHLTHTREVVCDQVAATLTGRREYARSLLHLASLLLLEPPLNAPHAIGILDAHTFERRLMHLTENHAAVHGLRRALPVAAAALFIVTACTIALALRVNVYAAATSSTEVPASPSPHALRVSSDVLAGQILTRTNPTYPQAARDAKIQGAVVLHAIIGKDGAIANLTVVSGPEELRASALDAVHQWIYKPYLLNGDPTEVETTITVNYSLE